MRCHRCRILFRKEKTNIPDMIAENAYQRIFDQMNNEINRLWQRSIFLGTFLVLIFVGYGNVLLKLFSPEECCRKTEFLYDSPLNIVCVGISILGVAFSVLWIMMGKSSKAWQEKYEQTIYEFEDDEKNWNQNLRTLAGYGILHGRLKGIDRKSFSNCLLSTDAGAFSPSRINIALGQISLIFWCLCALFHFLSYCLANNFCDLLNNPRSWGIVIPAAIFIFTCICICCRCESGVIQRKQEEEEFFEDAKTTKTRKIKIS